MPLKNISPNRNWFKQHHLKIMCETYLNMFLEVPPPFVPVNDAIALSTTRGGGVRSLFLEKLEGNFFKKNNIQIFLVHPLFLPQVLQTLFM